MAQRICAGKFNNIVYILERLLQKSRWFMKHPFLIFICPCCHISCLNVLLCISRTHMYFYCHERKKKNTRVKNYRRLEVRHIKYRISVDRGQNKWYVTSSSMDYCILWGSFLKLGKCTGILIARTQEQELQMNFNSLMTDFMTKAWKSLLSCRREWCSKKPEWPKSKSVNR